MRQVGEGVPTAGEVTGSPRSAFVFLVALLLALLAVSRYNYPLFHMIVEGISVIVASALFLVLYHTRRLHENDFLLFIGIGLLFFVVLDVPHTLGFQGIRMFPGFDNNLPTQAYIAQRLILGSTFVIAPLFLKRRLWVRTTFIAFGVLTAFTFMSLLVWKNFPAMFMEGQGLTPLKRQLEFLISALFVVGGIGMVVNRRYFDPHVLQLLLGSLVFFVGSEMSFTLYQDPFGFSNLAGHLFQVVAFYLTYRAVLVTALVNPFGLLFRELSEREHSLTEANERLNAVADISDAAMSSLDIAGLAERLLDRLARVMRADAAALLLAEDGQLRLAASVGFSFSSLVVLVGEGFSGRMASERRPRYVEDAQAEGEVISEPLREQGIRSALGVPMLVGDRLIGTLHVDWRVHHAFDERDLRLLEIVGDRIALAMRNAQLYEGERRIAQIFQEALLSLPEHINGVEYAKAYHSATEEAWVGGDFFDLFPVDSRRVGVLIGDVSGKGIEAAVLTSIVKDTIRAHVHEGSAPAEVLHKTNALVEHYSNTETFVTVFFGVLERATGRFTYCNAGHLPALSLDCRGTVSELSSNSPLLGALPDVEFTDDEVQLPEGQTLFLFTDGLVEARSGTELYEETRLLEVLRGLHECAPQDAIDAVLEDLMAFTGGSLNDDLAILALKLVPEG